VEFRKSIDIDAPPDVVWPVMADGERWPEWTASVTSVRRLDKGPLRIGSRALIRQPRFPPAVWTVTALGPGRRFVRKPGMPGMWVYGDHSVEPTARGTRATLRLSYDGALARFMGRLTRGITNRYLDMEASGLKNRSEEIARAPLSVS
jgi:Polyketide cyclase / dehydrase and lipid transport